MGHPNTRLIVKMAQGTVTGMAILNSLDTPFKITKLDDCPTCVLSKSHVMELVILLISDRDYVNGS